jgi:hypothetical protein
VPEPTERGSAEAELLALLGLRLHGFASADAVAEVVRVEVALVEEVLHRGRDLGWVRHREGRMTGWSLTPQGRSEGERRLAAQLEARGCRPVVEACYARFRTLNVEVLAACTDWQLRAPTTVNDHLDAAYDAAVVDRLARLHVRAQQVCDDLGAALERFEPYGHRLHAALARVRAGDREWFTGVRIPSYHAVWFELHENLLATLGIDRSREPTA